MDVIYVVLFVVGLTFILDALIERRLDQRERERQTRDQIKKFLTEEINKQEEDK